MAFWSTSKAHKTHTHERERERRRCNLRSPSVCPQNSLTCNATYPRTSSLLLTVGVGAARASSRFFFRLVTIISSILHDAFSEKDTTYRGVHNYAQFQPLWLVETKHLERVYSQSRQGMDDRGVLIG